MGEPPRRIGRLLLIAAGSFLLVCSAVASLPLVFFAILVPMAAALGEPPSADEVADLFAGAGLFLVVSSALAVVCWLVGIRLVRGRRRLVLFLRRFGFTAATSAVTYAVGRSVGARWRVVTLDDHEVAPVGVARPSRWLLRFVRLLAVVALALALWWTISWLRGDAPDKIVDDAFQTSLEQAEEQGQNPIEALVAATFGGIMVGVLVLTFTLLGMLVVVAAAGTSTIFLSLGSRSVRRAEHAKALVIARPRAVDRSVEKIRKRTRRVFAPRMIVARVANPLWQRVVRRLATMSDAVIVDVSEPSDNVAWELRQVVSTRARWIPVGRLDRLHDLQIDTSPAAQEIRFLLDRSDVLGYTPDEPDRFAAALHVTLDAPVDRSRHRSID